MRRKSSRRWLAHKPSRPKQATRSSGSPTHPKISDTFIRNNSKVPFILLRESRMRGTSSRRGLAHKPSRPKQAPRSSGTYPQPQILRSWILKNSNPPTTLPKKEPSLSHERPQHPSRHLPQRQRRSTPKPRGAHRTLEPTVTPQKHHNTEGVTQHHLVSLHPSKALSMAHALT